MLRENWLHINVAINWQLSKQGMHWPVSPDRLRCLPIQVEYFLKLSADYFWSDRRLKYIFLKIHMKYVVFMSLWPRTIKMLISNWPRTRKFSQSSFYATDWSKFDRWVQAEIYTASWNLFTLTAEADRVLCQLVMFLTVFFHWMYKMKYSCYQEFSVIHGWFVYWMFCWEMSLVKVSFRFRMESFRFSPCWLRKRVE